VTSDGTLSHLDTLGRALREVSGLLRASEVQVALEGLRAAPPFNETQREAAGRVHRAADGVRDELDAMRGALRESE
jgi:uncharacterized protein YfaT (DUF1175 family)